jgi:predicted RND superfamily exporter protein
MNSSRARWLDFLHRFSIRHPIPVLVIAAAVTAAASPGILNLRLRTDGQALVPEQAPAVRLDRAVRREFGVRDPVVVLVRPRAAAGIFTPRTLRLVSDLTAALVHLPGVDSAGVTSLATERSDRFRPRSLVRYGLLEPLPETPADLDRLRGDLDAFGMYKGTLVSFDGGSTAFLVGTPWGVDRTPLVAAIRGAIASSDTAGHDVSVIGAPVAEALLGAHILEDLGVRTGLRLPGGRSGEGLGALSRLRLAIARDVGLLPLSIALMALVFLLCFRSLAAVLLPLGEAAACLVVVFGAMGWTGTPVFLTMAVLPVILVSMGLADEIHVFHCYRRHRAARPEAPAAEIVGAALDDMSLPVVATSLTTAAGFLSFAISPLPPVRAFGVFTAVGIVFCMLWTLTVIPALLALLAPRGLTPPRSAGGPGERWWLRLAMGPARHPVVTLAAVAVALALMAPGWRRIVVQDSWISGFAPDSDFYRDTQYFNRHFFGTHRLLLVLEAERVDARALVTGADLGRGELRLPGGLLEHPERAVGCSISVSRRGEDAAVLHAEAYRPRSWGSLVESVAPESGRIVVKTPLTHGSPAFLLMPAPGETLEVAIRSQPLALPAVLRSIEELERFVRSETRYAVGGVLGPPDHIVAAEFVTSDRQPEFRRIPGDPERVRWLWGALGQTLGPERLREIVDPTLHRGLVTVFLKNANFADTERLMEAVRGFERERLAPLGIRLEFAGDVAVSQALIEAIVHSQVRSILGSLIGILVVTAVLFRSLPWGVICMLPAGLAVAATFGAMGWTGIPLGVATSMFAAMVLGVGVDFAIHLVEGYRQRVARGADPGTATAQALEATGPAIVANALALALGFGLLALSRVPANARLGAITVVSLLACVAATFLVIPALLRLGARAGRPGKDSGRR